MAKTITVDIDAEGEVNIEASGFKGGSCTKATADLVTALGGDPADFVAKPEYQECVRRGVAAKRQVKA